MPFVTTDDDCDLYVKEWGPENGKPVVLIHGWPLNADSWDDVANGLANAGYRAIAYDRRGFGRSDQPWEGYDYDTLADDLGVVIEEFAQGQQAAIVGFSMGGGEVARYLAKHGAEKVSHAVLIASVVPFLLKTDDNPDGTDKDTFDEQIDQIVDDRADFMQSFGKQFYGAGLNLVKPVSQGVLDHTFQMAMMGGLRPTLACHRAFSTTDFRPDCAKFTVPTLIIHGTGDKIVPIEGSAKKAAELIPHAKLVELDGEPHGLLVTQKMQVTDLLVEFLGSESRSAFGMGSEGQVASGQQTSTLQTQY